MNHIIQYYQKYICQVVSKKLYDDSGSIYRFVDEEAKEQIESKLLSGIIKFKLI